MNTDNLSKVKTWILVFVFLFAGVVNVGAEIRLGDTLTVTGFVRQSLATHIAQTNPNNKATVGQRIITGVISQGLIFRQSLHSNLMIS